MIYDKGKTGGYIAMHNNLTKPDIDSSLPLNSPGVGQLNTMIMNGKLSINHVKEKKYIEEVAKEIMDWEKDKNRLLTYSLSHEMYVKHIISILDTKTLNSEERYIATRKVDPKLFETYPLLKRYSAFVISFLYEEYCDWCDIGNFYLYIIGRSILYDNFENDAILAGSAFVYEYNKHKDVTLATQFAKNCVFFDDNYNKIANKIIAINGVLKR